MILSDQQKLFPKLLAQLIEWAYAQGYELTLGEAYRTPEQALFNAQSGKGVAHSLHTQRLAIDMNLFIGGVYQTESAAYKPLGDFWKTLHELARWGGDFTTRPDGNHFSLEYGGVR